MNFLTRSLLSGAAVMAALPLASTAQADVPQVVTDIAPVGAMVATVMGDLGQPQILLDSGGSPHHYQLRPSQARAIQNAGLVVWIGPELSPWLERAASEMARKGESLPLLHVPGTHLRSYAEADHEHSDDHEHEHEHEHEHDHGDDHDHEGHNHEGIDAHAWLDPENGRIWLAAIAEALAKADPENASAYRANASAGVAALTALEAELQTQLAPAKDHEFVVFHDAYGYFTQRFGLKPALAVSLGDASSPSAARLKDIQTQIQASGARCAFPETGHDTRLVSRAIENSAANLATPLDPLGSDLPMDADLYIASLRNMGNTLSSCLSPDTAE